MAESSVTKTEQETEIKALKETLQAQQELLQKLYVELDEERESSSTAASEALSMILRIQGQKAVVELEASQYKRMVEEKMFHTEESLAAFEDLMYQKDMEITALEFQVEAYKCKLLSIGFNGDMGVHGIGRRNNSLPPQVSLKRSYPKRVVLEKDIERESRSPSPLFNAVPRLLEEKMNKDTNVQCFVDLEKNFDHSVIGNLDSYWEQIRKLDGRVKEMSDCSKDHEKGSTNNSDSNCRSRSSSLSSSKANYDPITNMNPVVVTGIQDIFEVPQINHERKSYGKRKKEEDEWFSEGENRLEKPDLVSQEAVKPEKTSCASKMLHCTQTEILKPREGLVVKCHMDGVFKAEIQQLTSRMERLETRAARHEISEQDDGEMNLLKEMHEQLNSIQSEMRSWRRKNKCPPPMDDSPLHTIMEAMLYFWL